MKFTLRHTTPNDHEEISKLRTKSYSSNHYEEEEERFTSKIKGCYEGCLVADLDGIIGYIISFPYLVGKPYPIDNFYEPIENSNCWYIHDLCVCEEFRKKGIAKELAKTVVNKDCKIFCLTAIEGSENFWGKIGFRTFFDLNYCGKKANYMILIKN